MGKIIIATLLIIGGIYIGVGYKSTCPDGWWSPENHCSTLCDGHNHSINITRYANGFYSCECPEGSTGLLKPVCA